MNWGKTHHKETPNVRDPHLISIPKKGTQKNRKTQNNLPSCWQLAQEVN